MSKCVACNGTGYYDSVDKKGRSIRCSACDGTGYENTTTIIDTEELQELQRLAEIGQAVEYAIRFSECDDYLAQANITHSGQPVVTGEMWGSVSELLDWYRTHKPTE